MRAILIPVKMFSESKKRLAARYSTAERVMLAGAMCEDFFATIAQVQGVDRVFVVSQEPRALHRARRNGWEIVVEQRQTSESHSVDVASRHCIEAGVSALLRVPIDIPLAMAHDIESLFDELPSPPCCVVVPSHDGNGTNALLRSPPDLFPSHFGPNSFALHLGEAKARGARAAVRRNPRIELDIDEIDDLRALNGRVRGDSALARWMARYRV